MQTSFSKPPSLSRRARKISAIPPVAIFATSVYFPKLLASEAVAASIRRSIRAYRPIQ